MSKTVQGILPLVIGITGHRDLRPEDIPALENRVREIFADLHTRFPDTPLTLLSPLAEGADRLAARVALEFSARLIVPMPMRRDLYEQDFETLESQAEFEELLRKADQWFELPPLEGHTDADIQPYGPDRNQQYALVGAYIVRHSQLLIALWDGVDSQQAGGTSEIVSFWLEGIPEPYAPPRRHLDSVQNGPLYHIVTPRVSNPQPNGTPLSVNKRYRPSEEAHEDFDALETNYARIYTNMNTFNRDSQQVEHSVLLRDKHRQSKGYLFPEEKVSVLSEELRSLRESYAVADTLAQYYQGFTMRTLRDLFLLFFIAISLFEIWDHAVPLVPLLLIYVALMGVLYARWVFGVKRSDSQNKYQDYRAVAEGLRVQFFWRLASLPDSAADHYLRKQSGELDWIRNAVRVWSIVAEGQTAGLNRATPEERMQRMELVRQYWVEDQAKYFRRAGPRNHAELERHERRLKYLLWPGITLPVVVPLLMAFVTPLHEFIEEKKDIRLEGWILALIALPAIIAALLHAYTDKKALPQHAKQYERMQAIFSIAQRQLQHFMQHGDYAKAQALVLELGKEALAENGDWVLMHRERPVEVPQGA